MASAVRAVPAAATKRPTIAGARYAKAGADVRMIRAEAELVLRKCTPQRIAWASGVVHKNDAMLASVAARNAGRKATKDAQLQAKKKAVAAGGGRGSGRRGPWPRRRMADFSPSVPWRKNFRSWKMSPVGNGILLGPNSATKADSSDPRHETLAHFLHKSCEAHKVKMAQDAHDAFYELEKPRKRGRG